MKIIAVQGKSDVGKSSVIKTVALKLIKPTTDFQVVWMNYPCHGREPDEVIQERWYTKKKENVSDICLLLEKGGKFICLLSGGDCVPQIQSAYERTVSHLPFSTEVILICACHPGSPARKMLDAWARPENVEIIEKLNVNHDVSGDLKSAIEAAI